MISSSSSTNLTQIWSHAKSVRANFIKHSRYQDPTPIMSFDLFGGNSYYYYDDNENTSDSTTETPNNNSEYDTFFSNSESQNFIDQENIDRNYKNMHRLLSSNYYESANSTKNIDSITKEFMKNGALIFVFLNSNPSTVRKKYLAELFDQIMKEELFKAILMTNELIKNISPVEKDIAINFFSKLASLIGFQYILPTIYDHPLDTSNISTNIQNTKGFLKKKNNNYSKMLPNC